MKLIELCNMRFIFSSYWSLWLLTVFAVRLSAHAGVSAFAAFDLTWVGRAVLHEPQVVVVSSSTPGFIAFTGYKMLPNATHQFEKWNMPWVDEVT